MSGYKTQKRGWIRNHDIILYYLKSEDAAKKFNKEYLPYPEGYRRRDGKLPTGKGIPIEDTWNCSNADVLDSIMIKSFSREKTGYPTQKTLALYERIVRASSNRGDFVLDPFCGCATTPIAAERLDRQWVGMDIWDKALDVVVKRLQEQVLGAPDGSTDRLFTVGDIVYSQSPPERTDSDADGSVPFLQVQERLDEPGRGQMSREQMFEHLSSGSE